MAAALYLVTSTGGDMLTIHHQTDLEDCANAFVAAAKNGSMTGQELQVGKESLVLP